MQYIPRKLERPLQEALQQFPVVLVTGPRQAGKSTLLRHALPNYHYVTLDDLLVRNLALTDPKLFLASYQTPLIIDEIQYAPELLSYLKIEVDAHRRSHGRYVLTGSQLFSLMKGVSESLAGRVAIFQLYPLSWGEISSSHVFDGARVAEQMHRGFYPEFQMEPHLNPSFWHGSYLTTYLERDLRTMRNIHDLSQFQRFLVLLAARAGQLFNLAEIGKECGISQTTAKDWLMLLQATSILYLLEPYSRNMTKRVVKSPKLLFVDTGLLCYLLRIESAQQLMHGPFAGHVFENMVIMDKIKQFAEQGKRPPCYFYRSAKGEEVDLIIDHGAHVDAYEIKYTMNPNAEMAIGLLNFRDEHPTSHAALLTLRKEPYPIRGDLQALHWSAPINV